MKFSIIALIPAISSAAMIAKRESGQPLPTVEGDVSGFTQDGSESQPGTRMEKPGEYSVASADGFWWWCYDDFPFWSDGFCCRYNRYCSTECCGPFATFCSVYGYCYY